jgi:hypothetical protein
MSKSGSHFFAAAAILLSASSLPAVAQQARDSAAPPQLEKLEEVTPPKRSLARDMRDAASATAAPAKPAASGTQITQTREQGVVTEVQVKSGAGTYYLKPNTQPGTAVPGDAQSNTTRPAQWQIMQFDLKRQQDKKTAATQAASVPPPPDTPAAPAKK